MVHALQNSASQQAAVQSNRAVIFFWTGSIIHQHLAKSSLCAQYTEEEQNLVCTCISHGRGTLKEQHISDT